MIIIMRKMPEDSLIAWLAGNKRCAWFGDGHKKNFYCKIVNLSPFATKEVKRCKGRKKKYNERLWMLSNEMKIKKSKRRKQRIRCSESGLV